MLGLVTSALEEAFRAHAWGTRRLLEFCRDLSTEKLNVPGSERDRTAYTILELANHLVSADAGYVGYLTGARPGWSLEVNDALGMHGDGSQTYEPGTSRKLLDVDDLLERSAEIALTWETYLQTGDDTERLVVLDDGTFECRASVVVAHALHHGDLHREQICSALARLGLEPPDLQPWEYALDTGRARFLSEASPG
jgi:uncharacterized damage-inducible protein DinB